MSRWVALLAMVITACSQPATSHPVARATASPSSSAAPSPASSTSPSPASSDSPTAPPSYPPDVHDLPLTTLSFKCQLPIYKADGGIADSFVTFPAAVVTLDTNGHGMYYDRAFSRWLPVQRSAVSPDGAGYAYIELADTGFVIHLVAVASGKETQIHLSTQLFNGQPSIFDYSVDGIYLTQGFEQLFPGLWLVDPTTGSIRQVSKDAYPVFTAGNGMIWAQALNPADPNPIETRSSAGTLPNEIDRVDLRTGKRTVWLYAPGKGLGVVGLDIRGLPLIESVGSWNADPNAQLLLVAQPDSPTVIYKDMLVQGIGGGITDPHGTWLGGQFGIYLYTSSGALVKVSNHPGNPANGCF